MLHGIDPILTADLLHALRAMGHGDTIAIVDANFPAATCARRLVAMPGLEAGTVFRAVLSVLPVDDFIPLPLLTMQVVGDAAAVPPAVAEFRQIAAGAGVGAERMGTLDRHGFYAAARDSFVIVQTGDRRLYANVIATKGVIRT
ncbi:MULTISPECIES: RbsD/FucU family protein [Acidiphilium]|jgi:L-fucose mutarotase|uniref:RbsD or FucU transport n=1 Tax=Acidiphilium cryptum (strain JF-5) TaxID=349163 RepID=A5G2I4_ACICJ|nr:MULTISPECIES: RbsD/FucU domain-containing protein [Acidiphilium]MBU6356773.1 ribose ABC transporter [Rhodospirillales bacterium]ABQ32066.1 RbsD or FucU transport [Acidiphilium cryptum JF-5]EGO94224.1 RbsD or FucU transport [Acidiphilium sp. PM]KDM67753.1 fucose dissimilation pathway protein FucU [Acidiphilium sp. JA12-A1]MBS3022747.1 ribose ABC transporter [Acidiphilium multivorum]